MSIRNGGCSACTHYYQAGLTKGLVVGCGIAIIGIIISSLAVYLTMI